MIIWRKVNLKLIQFQFQEYARHLQDREERRLKERALARAQKQLEQDIARQTHETLSGYVPENSSKLKHSCDPVST